jgi:hypothetical protein
MVRSLAAAVVREVVFVASTLDKDVVTREAVVVVTATTFGRFVAVVACVDVDTI